MATVFNSISPPLKLSTTVYAAPLETVAPGVTALVDAQQTSNQSWPDVLESMMPSLNMTDDQRSLVIAQISNARAGIEPLVTLAKNNPWYALAGLWLLIKILR